MSLEKLPEDVGCVQFVRRFSDHPLGQAVFAPWPGVPHPFDGVKNDFGLSITRPVVESFDAVLVTRDFRAEGAAYHLRPRQKRLPEGPLFATGSSRPGFVEGIHGVFGADNESKRNAPRGPLIFHPKMPGYRSDCCNAV